MILTIKNISKKYGSKYALKNFSVELSDGVYGLLGPNGAGKTTLISIITGILPQDNGEILCDGTDVKKMKLEFISQIGYLPQYPTFYKDFKAREFLHYICAVKDIPAKEGKKRTEELLEMVNLSDEAEKKIGGYSGGMRQRLGIAQAMLGNPKLLILDEPTAGLDPKERIRFRNIIAKLSTNRIVLLSTHIVSDVEHIANEIILVGNGELVSKDTASKLIETTRGKVWNVSANDSNIDKFIDSYNISSVYHENGKYQLRVVSDSAPSETAVNIAPNLEDVFLNYFGEE